VGCFSALPPRRKVSLPVTPPKQPTEGAKRPVVLSIAGFDPSSGAGVTADLKVFSAHNFFGMACITALTVQSTQGVAEVETVSAEIVAATLEMLKDDVDFAGIKLGMLGNGEIGRTVNKFLSSLKDVLIVLDPVFRSSSGRNLIDSDGFRVVSEQLLRRCDWVTPNIDELGLLTETTVTSANDVPKAAEKLQFLARNRGNSKLNVLVTGGHLDRPDDYLLTSTGKGSWIPGERVETTSTHGTGCALSSALLCRLVAGDAPLEAATKAKAYVTSALRAAYPVGKGRGPMNHLFRLDSAGS
jgi:hydroxymethylpyrimidine/phosphomethylpyrimidine kinase